MGQKLVKRTHLLANIVQLNGFITTTKRDGRELDMRRQFWILVTVLLSYRNLPNKTFSSFLTEVNFRKHISILCDSITEIEFTYHKTCPFKVYSSAVFSIFRVVRSSPQSISERFHHLSSSSSIHLYQTVVQVLPSYTRPVWIFHVSGIIRYVVFCVWLLSFNMMYLSMLSVCLCNVLTLCSFLW